MARLPGPVVRGKAGRAGKPYDIEEHSETESGECHMVMRDPGAVLEIQWLLQEKKGALECCALKEAVADRPPEPPSVK